MKNHHDKIRRVRRKSSRTTIIDWLAKLPSCIPAFGIVLTIIAVILDSIGGVLIKLSMLVQFQINPVQVMFFRGVTQYCIYILVVAISGHNLCGVKGERSPLLITSIFGAISGLVSYFAIRLIPLSDMFAIYLCAPVLVLPVAYVALREPITAVHVGTGIITIMGAFITCRPTFLFNPHGLTVYATDRTMGVILTIVMAILIVPYLVYMRSMRTTSVAVIGAWQNLAPLLAAAIVMPFVDNAFDMPVGISTWILLLGQGAIGAVANGFRIVAYRYESAGPLALANGWIIVMGFLWDITVFGEHIWWTSVVGSALIALAIGVNAYESHLDAKHNG